jgi:tetratricopeptide (TPR) repeat protein
MFPGSLVVYWKRLAKFGFATILTLALASTGPFSVWAQRSSDAEAHARRAEAAIAENQPDIALTELHALLLLVPNDLNARASLGMVLFTQGRCDLAAPELEAALLRAPHLWNAKALLGICKLRLARTAKGQSEIEEALPRLTDKHLRGEAGLALVKSYADEGNYSQAAITIDVLQRDDPQNEALLFAAYRVHSAIAAAALQRLSQLAPESARVHQVIGDDMFVQENYESAINEYHEALKRDPRLAGVHLSLGQALLAKGAGADAAENEFKLELDIDPANTDAMFQLGQIAYGRGDAQLAASLFTKSLERRPSFADAHIALAKILSDQKRDPEAKEQLEAALKIAPSNRTAHYRLAQLYNRSGDAARAAKEFEAARNLAPLDRHKEVMK